jgi:hypothetical protein
MPSIDATQGWYEYNLYHHIRWQRKG